MTNARLEPCTVTARSQKNANAVSSPHPTPFLAPPSTRGRTRRHERTRPVYPSVAVAVTPVLHGQACRRCMGLPLVPLIIRLMTCLVALCGHKATSDALDRFGCRRALLRGHVWVWAASASASSPLPRCQVLPVGNPRTACTHACTGYPFGLSPSPCSLTLRYCLRISDTTECQ